MTPALRDPRLLLDPRGQGLVFLYSDDVDRLADFYVGVLGFAIRDGGAEPGHSYWVDAGAVVLVLHQAERDLPEHLDHGMEGPFDDSSTSTLLMFSTEDGPDVLGAHLEEAGVPVRFRKPGGRIFVIRDPEGRRLAVRALGEEGA